MSANIDRVIALLQEKYAVGVEVSHTSEGQYVDIGEIQGMTIYVNEDSRDDDGLIFLIAHLFGHMVQFTNYQDYAHLVEIVEKPKPLTLSEDFRREFYRYEIEAYKIGKGLLVAALGDEAFQALDERYQIYLDTDFAIFWDYLITGRQMTTRAFNDKLSRNYAEWVGRYPEPLEMKTLPEAVSPKMSAVVY